MTSSLYGERKYSRTQEHTRTHKNSTIKQLKLTKICVNFKWVNCLADFLRIWKIEQSKLTDTKCFIAVLEKPLNFPLVSCYLHTQHGHLSAVHDLIFNLNVSDFNGNILPKFWSFINFLNHIESLVFYRIFRSSHSEVFCKKSVLKNFTGSSQENICASVSFLNQVTGLRPATLLKKRLWLMCFPANFEKFLRKPFFIEHLWWLLLDFNSL